MLQKLCKYLNPELEPEPEPEPTRGWQRILKFFRRAEPNLPKHPEPSTEFYEEKLGIVTVTVLNFFKFLVAYGSHIVVLFFLIKFMVCVTKAFFKRQEEPREQPEEQQRPENLD